MPREESLEDDFRKLAAEEAAYAAVQQKKALEAKTLSGCARSQGRAASPPAPAGGSQRAYRRSWPVPNGNPASPANKPSPSRAKASPSRVGLRSSPRFTAGAASGSASASPSAAELAAARAAVRDPKSSGLSVRTRPSGSPKRLHSPRRGSPLPRKW